MYIIEILKQLSALGFIQWEKVEKVDERWFTSRIGPFLMVVFEKTIPPKNWLRSKKTFHVLQITKDKEVERWEDDFSSLSYDSVGVTSLFYTAMSNAEKRVGSSMQQDLVAELQKQFGLKIG